jgi:hypothetical protein
MTSTIPPDVALKFKRLREGDTIHVDHPGMDMTLCGFAQEGVDGDEHLLPVSRGKISCPHCLQIIHYAKAVPARYLAKGQIL